MFKRLDYSRKRLRGTHTFQGEEEGKPGGVGGREREQGGVDSPDRGGVLKTEMMTGGQKW